MTMAKKTFCPDMCQQFPTKPALFQHSPSARAPLNCITLVPEIISLISNQQYDIQFQYQDIMSGK